MEHLQHNFAEIDSSWQNNSGLEPEQTPLQQFQADQYQKAVRFWKGLNIPLIDRDFAHELRNLGFWYNVSPTYAYKERPTLRDVNFPDSLADILEAYGNLTGYGSKTFLSNQMLWELYGRSPIEPAKDLARYERQQTRQGGKVDPYTETEQTWKLLHYLPDLAFQIGERQEEFQQWFYQTWNSWFDKPDKFTGWWVVIQDVAHGAFMFDFSLTTTGKIKRLSIHKPPRPEDVKDPPLPDLPSTDMRFREGRLVFFWQEVKNGTYFPDPKGPKDDIYPYWVRGIYEHPPSKDIPGTKKAWEKYLARVKDRDRVISPRSWDYVYQTEGQARRNLEQWQDKIYYKTPQVFYTRETLHSPGLKTEVGYAARGRFGRFVCNTSEAYRHLDEAETLEWLKQWNPLQLEFNLDRTATKAA